MLPKKRGILVINNHCRNSGQMARIEEKKNSNFALQNEQEKILRIRKEQLIAQRKQLKKEISQREWKIYPKSFEREFQRLYSKLNKMSFSDYNLSLVANGYMDYLLNNINNFTFQELRKFRHGVIETIRRCAIQYGCEEEMFVKIKDDSFYEDEDDDYEDEDDYCL